MNSKDTKNSRQRGKLVRFFALKYLFSKKSHSLINVISLVSMLSIAVPVAALIILMSVFGGLNNFVKELNSGFDADIRITAQKGRYFSGDSLVSELSKIEGVEFVTSYIEENALAKYENAQTLVTLRGIDTLYKRVVSIENMVTKGEYALNFGELDYSVVGMGVAYKLGVNINLSKPITLYVPSPKPNSFIPSLSYRSDRVFPGSLFVCDAQVDGRFMLVPLEFAQSLLERDGEVTAIAVRAIGDSGSVMKNIEKVVGDSYKIEDSYEQNETIYKIMSSEKRIVFIISLLVVLVSSFSLAGSLIMLMADKREQMKIVMIMGGNESFVRNVFLTQGLMISAVGIFVGAFLGIIITLAQQLFGVIKINSQTLLIDSYPVLLSTSDVVNVVVSVAVINILITFVTVNSRVK